MKVLFVITGVGVGGAEQMLLKLASRLSHRFEPSVTALDGLGGAGLAEAYRQAGIPLRSLEMRGLASLPAGVIRLARIIRSERPQVVCTWLYHADLVGGLACRLAGHRRLAWNIRNSDLDPARTPAARRAIVQANARLSRSIPRMILCCSETARRIHVDLGYDGSRFRIVPNGFDLNAFQADPEARQAVRRELGIDPSSPLIGMIARFDPQKHHEGFLDAAQRLRRRLPAARFLLAGRGCDLDNPTLSHWINSRGLGDAVHLLGLRTDVPRITAALDLATLSSIYGEAFPNVLGEAMACEVPCVTTDVGDAAAIVGDTGLVVAPGRAQDLADAWFAMLSRPRAALADLGRRARWRVAHEYEIGAVRARYEEAFDQLALH